MCGFCLGWVFFFRNISPVVSLGQSVFQWQDCITSVLLIAIFFFKKRKIRYFQIFFSVLCGYLCFC